MIRNDGYIEEKTWMRLKRTMYEYENVRRIVYGDEGATFVPVCVGCGRFIKADETIKASDIRLEANATCKKCGRIKMVFEGFI